LATHRKPVNANWHFQTAAPFGWGFCSLFYFDHDSQFLSIVFETLILLTNCDFKMAILH